MHVRFPKKKLQCMFVCILCYTCCNHLLLRLKAESESWNFAIINVLFIPKHSEKFKNGKRKWKMIIGRDLYAWYVTGKFLGVLLRIGYGQELYIYSFLLQFRMFHLIVNEPATHLVVCISVCLWWLHVNLILALLHWHAPIFFYWTKQWFFCRSVSPHEKRRSREKSFSRSPVPDYSPSYDGPRNHNGSPQRERSPYGSRSRSQSPGYARGRNPSRSPHPSEYPREAARD